MSELPEMQSLWIGAELSVMERLAIRSFLENGHSFRLFVYDDVRGVPEGTTLADAGDVVPESRVFTYNRPGTYSGFSNLFRYKLLLDRGGWWVDLDTICLRPFVFESEYVFSSETSEGIPSIDMAVLKAPRGSELVRYSYEVAESRDPARIVWGETGPRLLADGVRRFGLTHFVCDPDVFCPVDHGDWETVLNPDHRFELGPNVAAVHLWNAKWGRYGRDKNGAYDPDCLYERLKARYCGRTAGGRAL